jgi:hypothetical protein
VLSVDALPSGDDLERDGIKSFPTVDEPSDHLMLAADLRL